MGYTQQKLRYFGKICFLDLHYISYFSHCQGNIPIKKLFKEGRGYSGSQYKDKFYHGGESNEVGAGVNWTHTSVLRNHKENRK